MKRVACIALMVGLAGCTSSRPMMAPSGVQGHKIWCEMPSQCYERAAKTCPYGYNIEANEKDYWGLGDIDGNLIITCKPAAQVAAQQTAAPVAPAQSNGATAQGANWWGQHKPAAQPVQPAQAQATRYKCTDVDGNPYVTTTPTKGCVVE